MVEREHRAQGVLLHAWLSRLATHPSSIEFRPNEIHAPAPPLPSPHHTPRKNPSFRSRGNCLISHSARDALARSG